jgi:predicted small secreted protein
MTLLRSVEQQPLHCVFMLKSQSTLEKTIMNNVNRPQRKARSLVIAAGALAMVALLGACNTFEGLGRDTERAGEALQDEAK